MDTALAQKFPFVLDRNLAKANCTGNHVCTSCDKIVLARGQKLKASLGLIRTYRSGSPHVQALAQLKVAFVFAPAAQGNAPRNISFDVILSLTYSLSGELPRWCECFGRNALNNI